LEKPLETNKRRFVPTTKPRYLSVGDGHSCIFLVSTQCLFLLALLACLHACLPSFLPELLSQTPTNISCRNYMLLSPSSQVHPNPTRGVSDCSLAIYIKKYLKAKEEELWKLKYFTMPKYNLQNIPLQETKILQDIITLL
jgi:hypothetical protein